MYVEGKRKKRGGRIEIVFEFEVEKHCSRDGNVHFYMYNNNNKLLYVNRLSVHLCFWLMMNSLARQQKIVTYLNLVG